MVERHRLFNESERKNLRRAARRYDTAADQFSGNRLKKFYQRVSGGDRRDYTDTEIKGHLHRHALQYRLDAEE